ARAFRRRSGAQRVDASGVDRVRGRTARRRGADHAGRRRHRALAPARRAGGRRQPTARATGSAPKRPAGPYLPGRVRGGLARPPRARGRPLSADSGAEPERWVLVGETEQPSRCARDPAQIAGHEPVHALGVTAREQDRPLRDPEHDESGDAHEVKDGERRQYRDELEDVDDAQDREASAAARRIGNRQLYWIVARWWSPRRSRRRAQRWLAVSRRRRARIARWRPRRVPRRRRWIARRRRWIARLRRRIARLRRWIPRRWPNGCTRTRRRRTRRHTGWRSARRPR